MTEWSDRVRTGSHLYLYIAHATSVYVEWSSESWANCIAAPYGLREFATAPSP